MRKIEDLITKGVPNEIIEVWQKAGYSKILPVQREAIEKGILEGESFLIVAPTSSGKTFVGEMTAVNYALRGRKTLYLVPFKALAEEKYLDFSEKFGVEGIGFSVGISDRDHRYDDRDIAIGNYDIAILTYEKLSSLLVLNSGILDSCDCIVIDEIQMLMDEERGANLELLLTKLKYVPNLQIIGLSAVLENLNGFDDWLNLDLIHRRDRPIELRQGVVLPDGTFSYIEWNTGNLGEEKFSDGSFDGLLEDLLEKDEQVIIIRNSVREVHNTAMYLERRFVDLPAASRTMKDLNLEPESQTRSDLLVTLRHSIAFHHADCEMPERRIIEEGFRRGEIQLLVATTTLSMGVNLPCKTVILADNFKWDYLRGGIQQVKWLVGEVQNIFGRAGRLGKSQDFGRGILLANNQAEMMKLKRAYLEAPLETLRSAIDPSIIENWVLDVVATRFSQNPEEVKDFVFNAFGAQNWTSEAAIAKVNSLIEKEIKDNLGNGLFEKTTGSGIKITDLGRVCAAKGVSIESFNLLQDYIAEMITVDLLDVTFAAALCKEVRGEYYRGVNWFNRVRRQKALHLLGQLQSDGELVGWIAQSYREHWQSFDEEHAPQFTIALLAQDILKSHKSNQEISEAYYISTPSLENICLNLSWMLDTLAGIADVEQPDYASQIYTIAQCIKNCAPLSGEMLNSIQIPLNRDEKIRLIEAGYKTEDDFIEAKSSDFNGIINPQKANQVIKQISHRRNRDYEFWQKEHTRRLDAMMVNIELVNQVYQARGRDLEQAICNLFNTEFADCSVMRITDQKWGEPDLLMVFPEGEKISVQVTARRDNSKFVDSKKAGEVIAQSARFHPDGYMCIGRPDFQYLAREQARHNALDHNYKLLSVYVLIELFVRAKENRMGKREISDFLLSARGYIDIEDIDGGLW